MDSKGSPQAKRDTSPEGQTPSSDLLSPAEIEALRENAKMVADYARSRWREDKRKAASQKRNGQLKPPP